MSFSDDILMAYADGELDVKTRAQVEDAMAADPAIARRVAAHQALRNTLHAGFDKVLEEPVPERLIAAARAASRAPSNGAPSESGAPSEKGVVVPFRPKRARSPTSARWGWPHWGAIAASFVLGALVLHFGTDRYPAGSVTERDGQLLAAGALDRALSNQLASEQSADAPVQIGVSFRSKDRSYCRTFQQRGDANLAGLACRGQDNKWRLDVLARGEPSPEGHSDFRQAGSAVPASIVQAVNKAIEGEPLDAAAEAQARTRQWRVSP